jgi:hypothetical protein
LAVLHQGFVAGIDLRPEHLLRCPRDVWAMPISSCKGMIFRFTAPSSLVKVVAIRVSKVAISDGQGGGLGLFQTQVYCFLADGGHVRQPGTHFRGRKGLNS